MAEVVFSSVREVSEPQVVRELLFSYEAVLVHFFFALDAQPVLCDHAHQKVLLSAAESQVVPVKSSYSEVVLVPLVELAHVLSVQV